MGHSAGMSALFPVLCTRELSDGVRLSQRLRPRQKLLYALSFLFSSGFATGFLVRSLRRHSPLNLPVIILAVVVFAHALLFAFTVYNQCAVDIRSGKVVVWKRGQSASTFPIDHVQSVTAMPSDMEMCPGVHILHSRGFVVVFRGLGGYVERCEAAKALGYAINVGVGGVGREEVEMSVTAKEELDAMV